jgi:hypothetical protein
MSSHSPLGCFIDYYAGSWSIEIFSWRCMGILMWVGIISLFALGAGVRYMGRLLTRVSAESLATTDPRPPVLFLRSFLDDQIKLKRPRRLFFRWLLGLGEPSPTLDHVLVEEGIGVGPIMALGVPGAPPPFGAARTYFNAEEWQTGVEQFVREARAIVIVADDTEGVVWELSHIRQAGYSRKTLYYLPPRLSEPTEAKRIIQREIIEWLPPIVAQNASAELVKVRRPCIGWFQSSKGQFYFLTTSYPSRASYAAAFRVAFGPTIGRKTQLRRRIV